MIILTATNAVELDRQWNCLIELAKSIDILELMDPFVSKYFATTLSDVSSEEPLDSRFAFFFFFLTFLVDVGIVNYKSHFL